MYPNYSGEHRSSNQKPHLSTRRLRNALALRDYAASTTDKLMIDKTNAGRIAAGARMTVGDVWDAADDLEALGCADVREAGNYLVVELRKEEW